MSYTPVHTSPFSKTTFHSQSRTDSVRVCNLLPCTIFLHESSHLLRVKFYICILPTHLSSFILSKRTLYLIVAFIIHSLSKLYPKSPLKASTHAYLSAPSVTLAILHTASLSTSPLFYTITSILYIILGTATPLPHFSYQIILASSHSCNTTHTTQPLICSTYPQYINYTVLCTYPSLSLIQTPRYLYFLVRSTLKSPNLRRTAHIFCYHTTIYDIIK